MEHQIATFDAQPSDAIVQTLLNKHDIKIALYDGHVERAAFTIVDDKTWNACKASEPGRHYSNDDTCGYHPVTAFEILKTRYPDITPQAISAPATLAT